MYITLYYIFVKPHILTLFGSTVGRGQMKVKKGHSKNTPYRLQISTKRQFLMKNLIMSLI